uniref:Uncharacterized protein LOC104231737 n=1 Tax=Nicotiana sylvestris TaxID=4096 RepID=A0A1U7WT32_NICSY|nr:PREDICTED: uncharacterized protein LOC104231737 [Nicotiana sylvestris]
MSKYGETKTSNGEKFTDIHPSHPLYLHPSDSPELANGMMYSTNATSVWIDLKELLDKKNLTRIYQLLCEICTISQGTSSISKYYSKLKSVWTMPCDYAKRKEYAEHMEQWRLVKFLMGLNEIYAQARSQVLLTVPVPTLNQAYNMIMQDESQRIQSNMISQPIDARQNNRFKRNNGQYCNYCNMKGHRRENCYKLVGYPSNHKFTKRRTYDRPQSSGDNIGHSANNVSHVEEPEASGSSGISSVPMFTSEQYNQLLKLINHEPAVSEAKVNMAALVKNQFSASIKIIRYDNGLEFFNAQYATLFTSLGIVHQFFCVHTPQQNGVAERKHRHRLEMAKALREDVPSSLPPTFVLTPDPFIAQPEPSSPQTPISPVMQHNLTPSPPSTIEQQPSHISDVTLRKSARTSNPPLWLTDYVHQVKPTSTPYPISSSLNYSYLSPSYQACLTYYSSIVEHTTFEQAAKDRNWMDVYNAFLLGDFSEEVYMSLPQGFGSQGENRVCGVLKFLYGLKQANRQWNLKLTSALTEFGFNHRKLDHSMFTKRTGSAKVIILVYVDDLLIRGNDKFLI